MSVDTPVSRAVLSDAVKDRLLQQILGGRYPPGSRIVETRVARELGTSQTPVREALRDLDALGLVEIAAFRGARVRRPSRDELAEAFVVRAELESLAARPLAGRLTPDDIGVLTGYLDAMRDAAARGDVVADAAADAAFHAFIVERAGNRTLARVWRQLEPHSRTYITLAAPGSDRLTIADLHAPILAALRAGDAAASGTAISRHFDAARSMLANGWPDAADPDAAAEPTAPPTPPADPAPAPPRERTR